MYFRFGYEFKQKLRQLAQVTGLDMSKVIRRLVELALNDMRIQAAMKGNK